MKRHLLVGTAMMTISVAVIIAGIWVLRLQSIDDRDVVRVEKLARAPSSGEPLIISSLKQDERIEITHISRGHAHWPEGRYYTVVGGVPLQLITQEGEIHFLKNTGLSVGKITETNAAPLTTSDAIGLDKYLRYLRRRVRFDTTSPYYDTFEVSYFKDGQKVGFENFVTDWQRFLATDYESLIRLHPALRSQITESEWEGLLTFRRAATAKLPSQTVATK